MKTCVAAGHPATVAAASAVLAAGGNAFDAAVAAGFAAAVAEPTLTGLGGGGFLLAHPVDQPPVVFDFFVDTPGLGLSAAAAAVEPHFLPVAVQFPGQEQVFNVGLGSVAVPGCLAGYLHVHRRLGAIDLADVLAPAIALAEAGVVLNEQQAYLLALLEPILTLGARGAAVYAPSGRVLAAGERLTNPDLARYLAGLRPGAAGFAEPTLAAAIAAEMTAGGGLLTSTDLTGYEVVEREPLRLRLGDREILTNPPPSFGGELVALGLQLLAAGGAADGRSHLERVVEAMVEVDQARAEGTVAARLRSTGGTTHVSISDAAGNVATMTTSNGESSGFVAPGTGVMLNNMLGEDDLHPAGFHAAEPGLRVASMMSPTIVLERGQPVLALGSGGSKRIRTAILQVVAGVVDQGLPLQAAIDAPRAHWDGEVVQLEPGVAPAALAALRRRWPVREWPERNLYFGGVHAVRPGTDAVGDPRRGGAAQIS